jgi:hypothetical protein
VQVALLVRDEVVGVEVAAGLRQRRDQPRELAVLGGGRGGAGRGRRPLGEERGSGRQREAGEERRGAERDDACAGVHR